MISTGRTLRNGLSIASLAVALLLVIAAVVVLRSPSSAKPSQPVVPAPAGGGQVTLSTNQPAAALQILAAKDPQEAATEVLARKHGISCMNVSDVLLREDPEKLNRADAVIASKGMTTGWIVEGETFVGDALAAAKAFNASDAFGNESSLWIVVVLGPKPSAMELRAAKSPQSHTIWTPTNYITAC